MYSTLNIRKKFNKKFSPLCHYVDEYFQIFNVHRSCGFGPHCMQILTMESLMAGISIQPLGNVRTMESYSSVFGNNHQQISIIGSLRDIEAPSVTPCNFIDQTQRVLFVGVGVWSTSVMLIFLFCDGCIHQHYSYVW